MTMHAIVQEREVAGLPKFTNISQVMNALPNRGADQAPSSHNTLGTSAAPGGFTPAATSSRPPVPPLFGPGSVSAANAAAGAASFGMPSSSAAAVASASGLDAPQSTMPASGNAGSTDATAGTLARFSDGVLLSLPFDSTVHVSWGWREDNPICSRLLYR